MKKSAIKKILITFTSDLLIAAAIIGLYSYLTLFAPKKADPITLIPTATKEFGLPDEAFTNTPEETPIVPSSEIYESGFTATGLSELGFNVLINKKYNDSPYIRRVTQLVDDTGDGARFVIYKVEIGEDDDKITYYTVDLYINKITDIKTNVAVNENGELSRDDVAVQAENVGAKLAISGDYFRNSKIGYIVRNGMLYRDELSKNDYCILYADGRMLCVDGVTFEAKKQTLSQNIWHCWAFGPTLLMENGEPIVHNNGFNINGGRYHSTDVADNGIQNKHPRSAIGFVEEGHYLLVLVDGRSDGYSSGASLIELSQIMYDEGCKSAYNLDGGRSAVLWYNGEVINSPYKDGREISDIIYIGKGNGLNG